MNRLRGENRLVSLVEKAKSECTSIALAVRNDLKTIEEAREVGLTWSEISEGLGFSGKLREVQRAYSREKSRRERKGGKEKKDSRATQSPELSSQGGAVGTVKTENEKQKKEVPSISRTVESGNKELEARREAIRANLDRKAREMAIAGPAHEAGTFVLKPDTTN